MLELVRVAEGTEAYTYDFSDVDFMGRSLRRLCVFVIRVGSTAPVEEIEAETALLIATVAIVGVGIIEAVKKTGKGEQKV